MGLCKGTLTFSRYRLIGALPDHFPDFFNERIRKNAFQTVWRTAEEKAVGWTGLEDPLDTEFQYASYAQGRYLLFSLRIDRKSVAPSLLRLRITEAERGKLKETGQKKLYREQREAIREAVRLELLGRTLPVPSFFEICWSVPENTLIFCSLSDKVFEDLQELFRDSFQLTLCPYTPWDSQFPQKDQPGSGTVGKTALPSPPAFPPGIDPLTIGREFLTWLWFKSEERNGRVLIPGAGESEVFFIRRLVLESGDGEYAETVVCQGLHADLKEGKEALRQGKKITAARLRIAHDNTEWEFTFKADRFLYQSLKLPTLPENDGEEIDREGQLLERIYLIEKVTGMMDLLLHSFLELRLSNEWEAELSRMQRWISQGNRS
ncbi:MAG: recombination-associated protein RdgC [Deltaproteobacteria bacterium]|nr:recombination-associated protein RdgC [Deltaproteobacteria bacterium]